MPRSSNHGGEGASSLRILLVEDQRSIADVICAILSDAGHANLTVVGTAALALADVKADPPDLALVDLGLPDRDGADLIRDLRSRGFRNPILVLTSATSDDRILGALRAGGDGYLFKEDVDMRLALALKDLIGGGSPLSRAAATVVLRELRPANTPRLVPTLTARETSVIEALANGGTYLSITADLGIGINTVRTHIRSIYEKVGAESRTEAVNLAWNSGLLRRGG